MNLSLKLLHTRPIFCTDIFRDLSNAKTTNIDRRSRIVLPGGGALSFSDETRGEEVKALLSQASTPLYQALPVERQALLFSEGNREWQPLSSWVRFLIQFGHQWPGRATGVRRIALISMPCDSAAAGLITLGAMIRDLCNPRANDLDGHYDALLKYARLFLEDQPPGVSGRLRSTATPRATYQIIDATDFERRQLVFSRDGVIYKPNPPATHIYIDGEPPPQWNKDEGHLSEEPYRNIVAGADILSENLGRSYSGLCFAGRAAGEEASRKICSSIRFRSEANEFGLEQLLAIHGWSACNVSRVSFFNTLTKRSDRNSGPPALVVADGDVPFLKAIVTPHWLQSDIIGVIHRTIDRDKLEAIGREVLPNQWYTDDVDMLCDLPPVVRGISISIRRRRA